MYKVYLWQQEIWQRLLQSRRFGGHALLLKGKQGIGKFEFARNLANYLLCSNPTAQHEACGNCSSCTWFEQGTHPNFYQIEPEALVGSSGQTTEKKGVVDGVITSKTKKKPSQQISVEQIRLLTDFVYMSGHQDGYKIILIHPAEAMNLAAASALLKKLEEPPEKVLFILLTHRPQQLLPTIRSRCQQIVMPVPDTVTATEWLKQQEGIRDPETCLAAAGFAPLSALLLSEDDYVARHEQFIEQISVPHHLNPIQLAEVMRHWELPTVINWLQKWCYDLVSFRTTGKIRYYLSHFTVIEALASQINLKALIAYSRSLITAQQLSHHPLNARLFLEEILFLYIQIENYHVEI